MLRRLPSTCTFALLVAAVAGFHGLTPPSANGWEPKNAAVLAGHAFLELDTPSLTESSGLAFSHVSPHCVWSHNDSGDKARLYAFTNNGKYCGRMVLRGVNASDWEDMASFDDDGARLLVADVGDNDAQRKSVSLYLFDEPDPRRRSFVDSYQHLVIRYPRGPQNCESVAVDVRRRRILMLGKSPLLATMYEVPLPKRPKGDPSAAGVTVIELDAKPIQSLAIPLATGMDLCPTTGDLWISNYLQAYRFPASKRIPLETRLRQMPEIVDLPKLKQVEAIAVDDQGRVWVTSEGIPAKMQRIVFAP
ncbi:hypothetical protein Enr13x_60590 [Stieleria neptunia]|uniref:SMP-30/Gluconolaconase/LRE-like region n=1 Tax=Stieleria neptunia TaxID=2527979 RepID=A0A518HZ76_9BACT|nr:hypothetical protein [Stieleria neptunia]QDV46155.1 hypothetical protein Enr13x_60590 [Stieleria neptunia]